ncbi:linear gramicidin synthase subunit D [Achaetomium macrosporum]|uniref:Linear gramicidin synthase subunit D n=1 Tax=Achaetomium macrosporum TaxID=79813 RepID=A0AAN7C9Z9_9PEZI|nr:linear gramicidin synthase subunit D [Achaetomium macrosporum]
MANSEHARIAQWRGSLLPNMVDRLARDLPHAVYGEWPVLPTSYEAGFRSVTYAELANVVNGLAWWLIDQLGHPSQTGEVLAFIGPNDVRLTALILAAVKTRYVVFFTSPRNSPEAHQSLFVRLQCGILLTPDPVPAPAVTVLEAVKPRKLTIPPADELLSKTYPHYDYSKPFEEARWDPLFIIHTSGSTGIPKPLIWTQESVIRQMNSSALAAPEGVPSLYSLYLGKRVLNTLPPFHGAGLGQYLFYDIPFGNVTVSPATATIATAQGVVEALKRSPADIALLAPSIVAELAQSPDLLEYCAEHLELIIYIGGDLPQALGDRVAAKVPLRCQWGASEVGIPSQLLPAELSGLSDWHYVRFHPRAGIVFDETVDGVYELVVRRDEELADMQLPFSIRGLDQLEEEYRTRDLFEPHPTVPDAWCWRARADDVIVFLNGEKTNPVSMEHYIVAHAPELSGALVLGAQRFQAALLIEPAGVDRPLTTAEQAALVEHIWPLVEEANRAAPAHARIEKSLVLLTTPDRPLIRTPKGTIQRTTSIAQYSAEIDRLYADAEVVLEDDTAGWALDPTDINAVKQFVRESVSAITGWNNVDDSADFFERGMDSLQVLQLSRILRRSLYRLDFGIPTMYQNPTISQLAAAVMSRKEGEDDAAREDPDRDLMEPLLSTYRTLIHQIPTPTKSSSLADPNNRTQPPAPVNVVLTGSTGALGTLLLHGLLRRPEVGHVFCLNRSADGGRAAQAARFAAAGIAPDILDDTRISFLHADLSAGPSLGLDDAAYTSIRTHAALIIHNAWPVNFNLALPAFRPQLAGMVNLFALAAAASRPMRVVFISSVGAVGGLARPAEEVVYNALDTPFRNGYSRSKFLAEQLCDAAARHLGVPVWVLRVGQIAGSVGRNGGGMPWNRAEWLPRLVLSSLLHLRCLPDGLGPVFDEVDWLPADLVAEVVCDIALLKDDGRNQDEDGGADVFHLRNPRTTPWRALLPAIVDAAQARFGPDYQAPDIVPPSVWVARLQESVSIAGEGGQNGGAGEDHITASAVSNNPGMKLVDFYCNGLWAPRDDQSAQLASGPVIMMSVKRALATSATLRDMPAVSREWMRKWVDEWIR